jgi:hypothetical protein
LDLLDFITRQLRQVVVLGRRFDFEWTRVSFAPQVAASFAAVSTARLALADPSVATTIFLNMSYSSPNTRGTLA